MNNEKSNGLKWRKSVTTPSGNLSIKFPKAPAGALGNFIDRLPDGVVTDFLHFKPFDFSLFIFNFADAYITLGAIIFIFSELILLKSKHETKN